MGGDKVVVPKWTAINGDMLSRWCQDGPGQQFICARATGKVGMGPNQYNICWFLARRTRASSNNSHLLDGPLRNTAVSGDRDQGLPMFMRMVHPLHLPNRVTVFPSGNSTLYHWRHILWVSYIINGQIARVESNCTVIVVLLSMLNNLIRTKLELPTTPLHPFLFNLWTLCAQHNLPIII